MAEGSQRAGNAGPGSNVSPPSCGGAERDGSAGGELGEARWQAPERFSPQRSPGGARAAVSECAPAEQQAGPKQFPKAPDASATSENISPREPSRAAPRKRPRGNASKSPSPGRLSPWRSSKEHTMNSFNLSPKPVVSAAPRAKRRSWRRSSLKGTKRRKSLPPVHRDVSELSKSISLDLPEPDRLSLLLLSSFQFSAQKFKDTLKETDGFSPELFKANAQSVSEELKRYVQKLHRDGTLTSCVDDPKRALLDPALDESVAQIKEQIARFAAESQSWDELLLRYRENAEESSRRLEEHRQNGGAAERPSPLQPSQAHVLGTKPNYQQILDEQGEVLSFMELVLDELQQAVQLLRGFSEDSQRYLRSLSEQLAARTFRKLESSPVRKLITTPPRKPPLPEG
ncbi:kinetochore-associated protein DSN1 homolog isoform X1 [Columba livia]|uniref:kinetochore-associated protein DSN1 homolog isoform X1 n=2 Tax=Columba livia TaxID=8932 RepID=UPI0031BB2BBF